MGVARRYSRRLGCPDHISESRMGMSLFLHDAKNNPCQAKVRATYAIKWGRPRLRLSVNFASTSSLLITALRRLFASVICPCPLRGQEEVAGLQCKRRNVSSLRWNVQAPAPQILAWKLLVLHSRYFSTRGRLLIRLADLSSWMTCHTTCRL